MAHFFAVWLAESRDGMMVGNRLPVGAEQLQSYNKPSLQHISLSYDLLASQQLQFGTIRVINPSKLLHIPLRVRY